VFRVSLPPIMKSPKGVYIVGLRSRRSHRVQDCIKTMHEGVDGPNHVARRWACVFPYLLPRCILPQPRETS
jgi:hypothetical protein